MIRKKRGQAAIEFIVLIVILFSVFMVYTVSTKNKMDEIREQKEYILLRDVAKMCQSEIMTAIRVEDGYYRKFELPELLEGVNYSIEIAGGMIIAKTEMHEEDLVIPDVNGTVKKGENIITKQNGIVKIE